MPDNVVYRNRSLRVGSESERHDTAFRTSLLKKIRGKRERKGGTGPMTRDAIFNFLCSQLRTTGFDRCSDDKQGQTHAWHL